MVRSTVLRVCFQSLRSCYEDPYGQYAAIVYDWTRMSALGRKIGTVAQKLLRVYPFAKVTTTEADSRKRSELKKTKLFGTSGTSRLNWRVSIRWASLSTQRNMGPAKRFRASWPGCDRRARAKTMAVVTVYAIAYRRSRPLLRTATVLIVGVEHVHLV